MNTSPANIDMPARTQVVPVPTKEDLLAEKEALLQTIEESKARLAIVREALQELRE